MINEIVPNVAQVGFALRHGHINKFEAAVLDPANWEHLLDDSVTKVVGTFSIDLKQFDK
jgi:hypothetical protein